jgi:succinate dehydrogenase / fumarate reductase cytochrome b subunit
MTFMAEMTIKKRPKNLDLTTIRLPLPGKVSILHRISGVGLFLCLPLLLWLFGASLASPEGFSGVKAIAGLTSLQLWCWLLAFR